MALPEPRPGLVIRYAYLWHHEHWRALEERLKDRPYVVILSAVKEHGDMIVTVAPVTHLPPRTQAEAVKIPYKTKQRLGLDEERSWIVVTEINRFIWPGPDLRPVSRHRPGDFAYGYLPPRLFSKLKQSVLALAHAMKLKAVRRVD